jgi:hypothetical protein
MGYVKLLAELDLLKADQASSSKSEDDDEGVILMGSAGAAGEEASIYDKISLNSFEGSRGSLDEVDPGIEDKSSEKSNADGKASYLPHSKTHQR